MDDAREALVAEVIEQQKRLRRLMVQETGGSLGNADVTVQQLRLLNAVDAVGSAAVLDLAGALGVSASTATISVDRLVRRGFLARSEDPGDRRRKRFTLTPEGQALLDAIDESGLAGLRRTLPHLEERDLRDLTRVFRRLRVIEDALEAGVRP